LRFALIESAFLALPKMDETFVKESDASNYCLDVVFSVVAPIRWTYCCLWRVRRGRIGSKNWTIATGETTKNRVIGRVELG
jgi:hypothetical protein